MSAADYTVAVVGLGHIGMPLAVQYASRGARVVGADINPALVEAINAGVSPHADEAAVSAQVADLVADGRLSATTSTSAAVGDADVVVVIVPVMVDEQRNIDFRAMDAATRDIAAGLRPGTLVIYETTLPVGTVRNRFAPALVAGSGLDLGQFELAFSPERVLVGRVLVDLARYPKLVGGTSAVAGERAARFYRAVLPAGVEVWQLANAETAEMVKLAETTYRDVNIAYANELAVYAAARGIDIDQVIRAANSQPFSHIHAPGVGVGGHCIPVYPYFLFGSDEAGDDRFADAPEMVMAPSARRVNDAMSVYAVGLLAGALGDLAGRKVLVLGTAYRGDMHEDAFSVAFLLRDALAAAGAVVYAHDPYFSDEQLAARGFIPYRLGSDVAVEAAILQADHAVYADAGLAGIAGLRVFVDGRNALHEQRPAFDAVGVKYLSIGRP